MLKADNLSTFDNQIKTKNVIDNWFDKFGGTSYTNCFTPGPDTPRGMTAMLSGMNPKRNGCYERYHWPQYYLNKDVRLLWDTFAQNNYTNVMRIIKEEITIGFLTESVLKRDIILNGLDETLNKYEEESKKNDNTTLFLSLPDYHFAMDEYGGGDIPHEKGCQKLVSAFDKIFSKFEPDHFDHIFIFSDHGCKLSWTERFGQPEIMSLFKNRTKICLFHRKKGDKGISKNSRFSSITDILPTSLKLANIPYNNLNGLALDEPAEKNRFLVVEDYFNLIPTIRATHDLWAYIDNEYYYIYSFNGELLFKRKSDDSYVALNPEDQSVRTDRFKKIIELHSTTFKKNYYDFKIREAYSKFAHSRDNYSDGSARVPVKLARIFYLALAHLGVFIYYYRKYKQSKNQRKI